MENLHLKLVKVTETSALAASQKLGHGDKNGADYAATQAMRNCFNKIDFAGKVALGEGIKDNAPGLFRGETLGALWLQANNSITSPVDYIDIPNYYDIVVDPIEGTTPTSQGGYEAMSVVAVGNKDSLFYSSEYYMNKLAVGHSIAKKVNLCITDPPTRTIRLISLATGKEPNKITVCVLDRPRHNSLVRELRNIGCRIRFIQDCDVNGAIATAIPESGIDVYMGIGGVSEGVLACCALKCTNGMLQGMLCNKEGIPTDQKILNIEDLAKGPVCFCATGITDGCLLKGVRYIDNYITTNSVLMRSESCTIRWITAQHGIGKV